MLDIAKKAALSAGDIALKHLGDDHHYKIKSNARDFATEADLESEKEIFKIIQSKFPSHSLLSEEKGFIDNQSPYLWVIDPVDGTSVYSAGLPTYGISVALLKDHQPYLGVINLPSLNKLFWAQTDKGAFCNNQKISVNKVSQLDKALIGHDFGHHLQLKKIIDKLSPVLSQSLYPPALGSVVSAMAFISSGIYSAYIHQAFVWDFAAGAAILKEAGGKITDYQGKPIDWTKKQIEVLASNAKIHQQITDTLNGK